MKIEILQTGDNDYTVIVDDKFADRLCVDEALGVVASALFTNKVPLFIKTYEAWHYLQKRYGRIEEPIGLLEFKP